VIALEKLLEEKGHQVAIFSMHYQENLDNLYSDFWVSTIDYSTKNPGNLLKAFLRPIYSKEVKKKWNAFIDYFQPDIVHLHNIHTQLSPLIVEEAWKRSIPVYWTLHDYKLICPAYSFIRNGNICEDCLTDKRSVVKHRCLKNSFPGSLIGYLEITKWSQAKLEKYTTTFISPSIFLKKKMIDGGYSEAKIKQLYNFVDEDKFEPQLKKESYYVFLGRLSPEKGVETLLKAASLLPEFRLKIIGAGPLRGNLEKKYNGKNIEFLGHLSWEEIKTTLGRSKFMVIPSEWYENNPLSIIESFAVGTPVLGADIGGIPELVNSTNGRLFRSGDVEDLCSKIEEMMKIKNWDYQQISDEAKIRFSSENYYKELISIYTSK